MKRALLFFFLSLWLAAWAEQGQAAISMVLESPADNQILSGITGISGAVFSSFQGAQITVHATIDGQTTINGLNVSDVLCCSVRDDVVSPFPDTSQERLSGFALVFNVNYLPEGMHFLVVEAQDDHGSTSQLPSRTFFVAKPGGFTSLSSLAIESTKLSLSDDKTEVLVKNATATDLDSGSVQKVDLQLAWQESSQNLDIVSSQNVGNPGSSGGGEEDSGSDNDIDPDNTLTPITLTLETPAPSNSRGGIGPISGWTFTRSPGDPMSPGGAATISNVRFRLDGILQNDFPCCSQRPDVQEEYSNRPQALNSGFGILTNFNQLEAGVHNFGVEVQDSAGATEAVVTSANVVKVANAELLDMFDLSGAKVSLQGSAIELENVTVRDKVTQQTAQITADYVWNASSQSFTVQPGCGNGSIDGGEECDGATLEGETCGSLGVSGGTLTCRPRCPNGKNCSLPCYFNTQSCTGTSLVYVTNVGGNSVSVINALTEKVVATIGVGQEPRGIAATPDGKTVYVANFASNTVSVIDTATNTVTATLKVKKGPVGVTMSPDGAFVYVVNGLSKSLSIISTATNKVAKKTIKVGKKPQYLVLSADGSRGYVTNFANNSISILDLAKRKRVKNLVVGKGPNGLVLSADESQLYVVNFNSNSLSVVDTATRKVVKNVAVGSQPTKVSLSRDGAQLYVTNSGISTISVLNTFDLSSAGSLPVVSGNATDSTPDETNLTLGETRLYVSLFGNGLGSEVGIFSTITNEPLKTIRVGLGPSSMVTIPRR